MNLKHALLSLVDQIIIVKDSDKNIIYTNYEDKLDIDEIKPEDGEVHYGRKLYKLNRKYINADGMDYIVYIYTDITKHKKLEEKCAYDELTKLYNFGKTKEELANSINESDETGEPFVVIMADIDDFKKVNDTLGHIDSNDILVGISNILKTSVRDYDIVGRYGGEEFLIILKKCSLENAYKKTELLRTRVEELNIHDYKVTISFGLDIYDGTKDIEDVLKNADIALYESKHHGKNVTTIYDED